MTNFWYINWNYTKMFPFKLEFKPKILSFFFKLRIIQAEDKKTFLVFCFTKNCLFLEIWWNFLYAIYFWSKRYKNLIYLTTRDLDTELSSKTVCKSCFFVSCQNKLNFLILVTLNSSYYSKLCWFYDWIDYEMSEKIAPVYLTVEKKFL